jgi:hypothetical protein
VNEAVDKAAVDCSALSSSLQCYQPPTRMFCCASLSHLVPLASYLLANPQQYNIQAQQASPTNGLSRCDILRIHDGGSTPCSAARPRANVAKLPLSVLSSAPSKCQADVPLNNPLIYRTILIYIWRLHRSTFKSFTHPVSNKQSYTIPRFPNHHRF